MAYPPPLFHDDSPDAALALAAVVRFATVAYVQDGEPAAMLAPFSIGTVPGRDGQKMLFGHIVKSNPLFGLLSEGPAQVRLVFNAADGYVTPSVYAEKPISGKVVPTWNYVAAQIGGTMRLVDDSEMADRLRLQIDDYEAMAGSDWKFDDAPEDYLAMMMRQIAAVEVEPTDFRLHRKLSQNKGAERDAVRAWFERPDPRPGRIADWFDRFGA